MAKPQQQEIVTLPQVERAVAMTPMQMLNAAVERGDDLDKLERLMGLNDRWEAAQAQKAFIEAKAAFKATAPTVYKDKHNKQYGSRYASIDNVVSTLNAAMAPYGLDADWEFDQANGIKVTCTLTHVMGHKEKRTLSGPPDASGAKNPLQQIKSTLTYLKLATYEAVTGVATKEGNADDDGNGAGDDYISEDQQERLKSLLADIGGEHAKFLAIAKAESYDKIKTSQFADLEKRLIAKGAGGGQ